MENYQRPMGQQSVLKELKNMGIDRSFIVQSAPEQKEAHSQEFISKEELHKEILELRKLFDSKLQNMYCEVVEAKKKSEENAELKKELSELRLELQKVSKDQSLMQDQLARGLNQPAYAPIMPGTYAQPQGYSQQGFQQPQQQYFQPQPQQMQQPQQPRYAQPAQQAQSSEAEHPYQAYLAAQAPPKPVATKPIDRNNIAPSEVQLDKYFNFANKRSFKM